MAEPRAFQDPFGRSVRYVRLAVTDRCNLRCAYCMPEGYSGGERPRDLLTFEELRTAAAAFVRLGVRKFRLTGGEPLVRRDLHVLVGYLSAFPEVCDLALTTNGVLLRRQAARLATAGLRRVNISLDTLRPETFKRIALNQPLASVLDGIAAAEEAGLAPIKVNCVVMRGVNDDEVCDLARATLTRGWTVRFVEVMPMRQNPTRQRELYVPADEVRARLAAEFGPLAEEPAEDVAGPAREFRIPGARGKLGFITPLSHTSCASCNRVRLTPAGWLRLCLFGEAGVDLRAPLRRGATIDDLVAILEGALARKPESHHLALGHSGPEAPVTMAQIGG
jgi:cyclic pyranopterin phosphate synthase